MYNDSLTNILAKEVKNGNILYVKSGKAQRGLTTLQL